MPIFQKPLDWARRFLFNTSIGELPFPALVLPITHDWPLLSIPLAPAAYLTIAGNVATILYQPTEGRHGLVYAASLQSAAAAATTDQITLSLQDTGNVFAPLGGVRLLFVRAGVQSINLVGGASFDVGVLGVNGVPPVYVGPGQRLRVDQTSVLGGQTVQLTGWVLDLPANYPLRLP